jgi:small subunit ribosomal protein S17
MSEVSQTRRLQRELSGQVVSTKMDKTVVVEVERHIKHKLYGKYMWRKKKFFAHDEENKAKVGDEVILVESRPMSAKKRWRLREIISKKEAI